LIINGATNTVIDELSVPGEPVDTAVNSEAGCLYTANAAGNSVTVIDTKTTTVLGTIAVGSDPKAIAVDQNTGLIYVANRTGSSITVLRDNACFDPPPATAIPTRTNTPQARRVRLPLVEGPIEREQTPNDSVGSAQTIRSSRGISGRLEDAYDVYTFEAASDGPVSVRLLNIPESLSERVQLSVHLGSDLTNLANRRVFDTLAPWEGSFSATAGRYYVLVFTDPAFRSAATPYLIEASYP
jgi:YVTN family beta-propeller protein